MSKKLVALVVPGSGIHLHRIVNPLAYMPKQDNLDIQLVLTGPDEMNLECDILFYNKWTFGMTPEQVQAMQAKGTKVVVDVDDHWEYPSSHPRYDVMVNTKLNEVTIAHIRLANVVTCTTERLAVEIRKLNPKVVVIPNALPFDRDHYTVGDRVKAREISANDKTRFMYLAGMTHREDVKILDGKFNRIGSDVELQKKAQFILCGYQKTSVAVYHTKEDAQAKNGNYTIRDTPGEWDHMANTFRRTKSFIIYPSIDVEHYLNYYDSADVAIVPLKSSTWNSMKSELKLIEAGCKHIPVICSATAPYTDAVHFKNEGVMMIEKPDEWLKYIKYCTNNPNFVKEQGQRLYSWTKDIYDLIKVNKLREEVFNSL